MLIKDWEYDAFLKSILNYSAIIIHGPDRGKVSEKVSEVISTIKSNISGPIDIKDISLDDISRSNTYLYELAYQKSLLSELVIIKINMDLIKIDKEFLNFLEQLDPKKINFIILESNHIKNNQNILNIFKSKKYLALLNCYQDTDKNMRASIMKFAKIYNLQLDENSITYLSKRLGNDTMITKNEIKKLSTYANGTEVTFEEILNCIGDNSSITLFNLADSLGIKNKDEINYLYERSLQSGANTIIILRTIYKHINMLLKTKSEGISDIKLIKPYIHFSRHKLINEQLDKFTIKNLREYIQEFYKIEITCKLDVANSHTTLKKLLLSITTY
ncbi:DNA polymerase III subunit delta [Alphaproteobacteria bacterium]|nr:DNA polymerase III subunit delta [Alphaproteobacteria bacterium]